ncbi:MULTISPECIES: HAD family hydrolase [unclassified Meiothermus]|uniref:HAD family hydrolase n=1 Tax=unclassified Meiothermus TaxID=370471 RepID=UPI000D7BC4B6|nr:MULTISPECIES: HAD family hydrolase [unclassified Meiothermus]PZA08392.1 haloacid dehalogenase [Meiothermus sp. Pnk-1]RYM37060.1 HAD family hydrolase [Meiothermus sp. PNK-Is4]
MIRAILFDLDETLILDEAVCEHAFREAAFVAAQRYSLDLERLVRTAKTSAQRLWAQGPYHSYALCIGHSALEGLWAGYTQPEVQGLREWAPGYRLAVWREALAEQNVSDENLLFELVDTWRTARALYPRYPEVDALLSALSPRYRLGLVTNGVPDLQRAKIYGSNLASHFQAVAVSGELNVGKPDPKIFEWICARLEVAPAECVMVGDNPERDVAGAIQAGMRSVWVDRGFKPRDQRYPADLEVKNLLAMLPWLEELARQQG